MNKNRLKGYAPKARKEFIRIVEERAALLGLQPGASVVVKTEGDVTQINGRPYPRNYAELHRKLSERIRREGYQTFIEEIAYTWFNRFAALRFMEVNNFLSHGFRVLSNSEAGRNEPEILTHATEVDLQGLDRNKVIELKLVGNKDAELYKMLLVAQCNELYRAMPFLFERINDETEILLPDNLLNSDSVIRKLVNEIDEEDWKEVEIIGWLYQFYISEKKDEVIGKTVKSEDIPAATQLFTPNWIVKYMVQNSLGRLWLENHTDSRLKTSAPMEFYIEPAAEEDGMVNGEKKGSSFKPSFNPANIKILDPACGSGHILVEAYDLLKAIYTETGFSSQEIPARILKDNLFGLDIDERAAQMASFALLMKARSDDRKLFEKAIVPNVIAIPDSSQLDYKAAEIADILADPSSETDTIRKMEGYSPGKLHNVIIQLLEAFRQGKTLGSLIRIPADNHLAEIGGLMSERREHGNLIEQAAARAIEPFVQAAGMLTGNYDCVIANPPYMGGKGMNDQLKRFAAKNFPDSKSDLFAMFIERGFELLKKDGFNAMVTMQSWMFLSSYEKLREKLLTEKTIVTMAHLGARAFAEISGEVVQTTAFILLNKHFGDYKPTFFRLVGMNEAEKITALQNDKHLFKNTAQDNFKKIPGNPIAYWVSDKIREVFEKGIFLGKIAEPRTGLQTGENEKFVRLWTEMNLKKCSFRSKEANSAKWFPFNKGGEFRKWYGNADYVINWENNGRDVKEDKLQKLADGLCLPSNSKPKNQQYYFKECGSWAKISSGLMSVRYFSSDFLFDSAGCAVFSNSKLKLSSLIGFLNSNLAMDLLSIISPTLNYQPGDISLLPIFDSIFESKFVNVTEEAVAIARADWDSFETSWDFSRFWILDFGFWIKENPNHGLNIETEKLGSIEYCWQKWKELCDTRIARMQELETENNRLFIEAYGLQDELSSEVPLSQITLARADAAKDARRLASYGVGCMMGRYSLDKPKLVYADAAGVGFDQTNYQTFAADDDGIVPVTDVEWFAEQDAANRFRDFLRAAWSDETLNENLRYIAEQLGTKTGELPLETIRRYFSSEFFKDHLKTYKKRPIYWLFSSGKQKAFECLVYLHRYNENTLPRMRNEYVVPLMGKIIASIEFLEKEIAEAATTSNRNRAQKQLETMRKKQSELAQFDELLRHYADRRISLNLDDGVRTNYGKFGNLLAGVNQVAAAGAE